MLIPLIAVISVILQWRRALTWYTCHSSLKAVHMLYDSQDSQLGAWQHMSLIQYCSVWHDFTLAYVFLANSSGVLCAGSYGQC
jgi:hypothetical protein